MRDERSMRRTIVIHVVGFLALAALVWVDEAIDLPHHAFGATKSAFRAEEALLESTLVLALGIGVVLWIRRTMRRIAYLESLVTLCAWCRRVHVDGEWLTLEQYLEHHDRQTSHGLCPECDAKMLEPAAA